MKACLLALLTLASVAGILAARWGDHVTLVLCRVLFGAVYSLLWRGFEFGRDDRF